MVILVMWPSGVRNYVSACSNLYGPRLRPSQEKVSKEFGWNLVKERLFVNDIECPSVPILHPHPNCPHLPQLPPIIFPGPGPKPSPSGGSPSPSRPHWGTYYDKYEIKGSSVYLF